MAMADAVAEATPPTPPEEHPAAAESAVASQEVEAATSEVDNKRKLEEVSADAEAIGTGDYAKRPCVDDVPDAATGVEQQNNGFSVHVEEAAAEAPVLASDAEVAAAQEISRKINVPDSKVRVLIGKAGETIRNIQKSSGAKIQIDIMYGDVDSNALTRSVELIGSPASVDKAEQLIKSVIAEDEALTSRGFGSGEPGSEQFEMTVPNNKVGLIIGKGGETIKFLQVKSAARIQIIPLHPPEGVTLTERILRVTGSKKQIEVAKNLIKQALNQELTAKIISRLR